MKTYVVMCNDEPVSVVIGTEENALEAMREARAIHYRSSGCFQTSTMKVYMEGTIWYYKEVAYIYKKNVRVDADRKCVCGGLTCKYPNCKTGSEERIVHLEATIDEMNRAALLSGYNGVSLKEVIECDVAEMVSIESAQQEAKQKADALANCEHEWKAGIIKKGVAWGVCVKCGEQSTVKL